MSIVSVVMMMMSGPDDGQRIYLSREHRDGGVREDGTWTLLFGRREVCEVSIPFDTQVSRRHAVLRITPDGEFWLEDIGSLNGTFVGSTRIDAPTRLGRGQLFRLGRTWMRIQADEGGVSDE